MPTVDASARIPREGSTATTQQAYQVGHARVKMPVPAPRSRTVGELPAGTNPDTA